VPSPPSHRRVVFYPSMSLYERFTRAVKARGFTRTFVLRELLEGYCKSCEAKEAAQRAVTS